MYLLIGSSFEIMKWAQRTGVHNAEWRPVHRAEDLDNAPPGTIVVDLLGVLSPPDSFPYSVAFQRGVHDGRLTLDPFTSVFE